MKRQFLTLPILALWLGVSAKVPAAELLPVEPRQNRTTYNLQSQSGVPISDTVNVPPGSDGRQPTVSESIGSVNVATASQFQGLLSFGGGTGLNRSEWEAATESAVLEAGETAFDGAVAEQMNLPSAKANGEVVKTAGVAVMILRRAQVGVPFLSRQISGLFASVITPPKKDENGVLLSVAAQAGYWLPEPYSTNNHENADYYWSRHAGSVYANKPGPVLVTWRKAVPFTSETFPAAYSDALGGAPAEINGASHILLNTARYIIGSGTELPVRKIYWTEKSFSKIGKPVEVPAARVGAVNIAYSANSFPRTVTQEFVPLGGTSPVEGSTNATLQELRTLWWDQQLGHIYAYNKEGRVLVELLGDKRADGVTREQIGIEVVDVSRQVNPSDVNGELGERVIPPAPGTIQELTPEPLLQQTGVDYAYRHNVVGSDVIELYANRATVNLNDYLVHWMETGLAGLKWPSVLARYRLDWPTDETRYSHYVRPAAATDAEARETAVVLATENVPTIDYQDRLDRPRGKLTEDFKFYTWLDSAHPAHRTLLHFSSGEEVAFERVYSWLDTSLKTPALLSGTSATNLNGWSIAPEFTGGDLSNSLGLYQQLMGAEDSFSKYVRSGLSAATAAAYAAYLASELGSALEAPFRNSLAADLKNILLEGATWATNSSAPLAAWTSVAASLDGDKLIAAANGGRIYTSTDSGATWTARENLRSWRAVASSSDGSKLVAAASGDRIYTSTDSGATWTPRDSARNWISVASSLDGSKLVAAATGDRIYTSLDAGATWTPRDSVRSWISVASSADGTQLIAVNRDVFSGTVYRSTDSGTTWTPSTDAQLNSNDRWWTGVASSADGSTLVAVNDGFAPGNYIYVSTNSGASWDSRANDRPRHWQAAAVSSDGSLLVAVNKGFGSDGQIHTSADFGVTWTAQEAAPAASWSAVALSENANKLIAGINGGRLITSFRPFAFPGFGEDYQARRGFLGRAYPDLIFHGQSLTAADNLNGPRVIELSAEVGSRIQAPEHELGATGSYVAGHINQAVGNLFNPVAYQDPFASGFEIANRGAIIPVNAIPGKNHLEVWWGRTNRPSAGLNAGNGAKGFKPIHWPSVIGRYTIQWPTGAAEIVLASKLGSGTLDPLAALGTIYRQNDPTLIGYNPNEEHAIMNAGMAFATRDDLNITASTSTDYSSAPMVLVDFTDSDGRPQMLPFPVLREKPEAGWVFDYIVPAGQLLQAPMPLPILAKPVEGSGDNAVAYNTEPNRGNGDLPVGWNAGTHADGPYAHYQGFTFSDRNHDSWVYRGLHAGRPVLEAGAYDPVTLSFGALPAATAIVGESFQYPIHVSREDQYLELSATDPLPGGLSISGLSIIGTPTNSSGATSVELVVRDLYEQTRVTNHLSITILTSGSVSTQLPFTLPSTNDYTGSVVTFSNRPPYLAASPSPSNSFTMRFYYKTDASFDWPGLADPPAVGSIVPYLRPSNGAFGSFAGDAASKDTESLEIVYRPVWPVRDPKDSSKPLPRLEYGATLTTPAYDLAGVRDFKTAHIIYQQSIATNLLTESLSAVLHDPTAEKSAALADYGLDQIPAGVKTESFRGKIYFPNLPPHLSERIFVDPNASPKGTLKLQGEFKDETVGQKYVLLNLLRESDLTEVRNLCPTGDPDKSAWNNAVAGLSRAVETFYENPSQPGTYIPNPSLTTIVSVGDLVAVDHANTAVDSYAVSAVGPGGGYVCLMEASGSAFTDPGEPVNMHIFRVAGGLAPGELKIIESDNPLSELLTMQHTADLAGRFDEFEYEWKIGAPVDGRAPIRDSTMSRYQALTIGLAVPRYTLGGAGVQGLGDNWVVMRYRAKNTVHPVLDAWSEWTEGALAEGWIKRVLKGINPFNQRLSDLFNNQVNTDVSLLTQAGRRWEGDVALNLESINNYGLIEIYETVLRRGRSLSIESGFNYGPANDALLLAAGYLNDLYVLTGGEAWADAANPTIGIGTADNTYGDIATALFAFKGQSASLLDEELSLLRGRDDFLAPGVETAPFYNRLVWNYTRGIDAGEVIYALNYNIQENPNQSPDGVINAEDAALMFPQAHGDAYGHYLTALKGYYSLLINPYFDWVPRIEAVNVLGKAVAVDYQDERKFAATAAAVARTGNQVFDLTWRKDYQKVKTSGWGQFSATKVNHQRTHTNSNSEVVSTVRHWGLDHQATRTAQGTFLNWVVGNALLPDVDPNPNHEGIQKVDRTTVPELQELVSLGSQLQTSLDNAEGGLSPLGVPEDGLAFDINPNAVVGTDEGTHFDQVYQRAIVALNNAVAAFDDAKDVTRLMRSEEDGVNDLQNRVMRQELAYRNALIELYGTPYPDDIGPGKSWDQGYAGPDLIHFAYVDNSELNFTNLLEPAQTTTFHIDVQDFTTSYRSGVKDRFGFLESAITSPNYANNTNQITFSLDAHGFFSKPAEWKSRRASPGKIQEAISGITLARNAALRALDESKKQKYQLDRSLQVFQAHLEKEEFLHRWDIEKAQAITTIESLVFAAKIAAVIYKSTDSALARSGKAATEAIPKSLIAGTAAGGDATSAARGAAAASLAVAQASLGAANTAKEIVTGGSIVAKNAVVRHRIAEVITPLKLVFDNQVRVLELENQLLDLQRNLFTINQRLEELDAAQLHYRGVLAEGDRIQEEREIFRHRSAALVQGFRTRDAAFRIFRNEKLERYKTLFDLAARYALLTANAYDYETGLLNTTVGRAFVSRIINARALGVVRNGEPQFAGSNTGDPGLSSVLAEMKADWEVLRGRLGFNNPDAYGTTVSLRQEALRILPGTEGDINWRDMLQNAREDNILDDEDVRRYCMQVSNGDGLPVPGIVVSFSTTIADGLNLFGHDLAAGDHSFSPSSFATKIFGVGVAFEGYQGMDNPTANSGVVGGAGTGDPQTSFLDEHALSATPYVYLIPVGVDSMRSPPLGDTSEIRSWTVNDVAIPMPFNIGASDFSTQPLYQSSDSLTEPLFAIRKHQAFRPVSTTAVFSPDLYGVNGTLKRSQFTNNRLVGRSVWNSRWKLVIPGKTLLSEAEEGLERFILSVDDIKLHFVTYSYSGN